MKNVITFLLTLCTHLILYCQAGQLDLTFNTTGHNITHIEDYDVNNNAVLIQPDGKILVCGTGTKETNERDFIVARYTSHGRLDSTFNDSGFKAIDFFNDNDECNAMALQANGQILLTGLVTTSTPKRKLGIVRLLEDGSFDETFGTNGIVVRKEENNESEIPTAIHYQDDGSILVSGSFQVGLAPRMSAVFKFKQDGTPDSTFGENGVAITNVGEGYNPSLGIIQDDGNIITGGFLLDEPSEGVLIRFTPGGTIDSTYGANGIVLIAYDNEDHLAYSVALQDDHKLLVVAGINRSGQRDFCMLRYTEDGQVDSLFGINGRVITEMVSGSNTAHAVAVQEDQKILLAGFLGTTPNHDFAMARYMQDGSLDAGFGNGGKVITNFGEDDVAFNMAIQPDHKIVLSGHSIDNEDNNDFIIARYLSGLEIVGTTTPEPEILNANLYPNPAKDESVLKYHLKKDQSLTISLYDLSGLLIHRFVDNIQKSKGMNEEKLLFIGKQLAGHYIVVIESQNSIIGLPIALE